MGRRSMTTALVHRCIMGKGAATQWSNGRRRANGGMWEGGIRTKQGGGVDKQSERESDKERDLDRRERERERKKETERE